MSAPLKPWERPGINYQNNYQFPVNNMSSLPLIQDQVSSATSNSTASLSSSMPPQVPPRPSQQSALNNRFSPGLGYSSLGGYGGYGGYSNTFGYGGYGGMYSSPYSGGYGGYGYNRSGDVRSSFALQAEESSRPAFESIESIVQAVNSVGMMLDSTFQAVYNSFRAVIGVADNFTRLKSQLIHVFSALAFIRTLRYIFRKVLEFLHLRPKGEADTLWKHAFEEAAAVAAACPDSGPRRSSWPILLFFGMIMGGPYLIWKVISAFSSDKQEHGWAKEENDHFLARANFSFQGQSKDELSFSAGQKIVIAPKELQPHVRGWMLASVNGKSVGMIPANYVTILGKRKGTRQTTPNQHTSTGQDGINPMHKQDNPSSKSGTEFESAFSSEILSQTSQDPFREQTMFSSKDASSQDAADILNEIEK